MIRNFCDLCDKQVRNQNLLSNMVVCSIDDAAEYNRSDSVLWRSPINIEICLDCRIAILQKINELKKK